ncbi:phage tail domain-containing protein [Salinicoccus roseus]|uniref:phage tail domain-containing protein n=1 Tax=Salinicoccus roseus TaxID=45670 RepID=UPI002301B8D4|nr:phage tail domain-containing protein [Salinicoccus roseus]
MFKIYDLNYQEVSFPVDKIGYGLKALDLNLGPVIYNSIYSEGDGASGAPVKRYPADREASIRILFTAADTIDWRLKRSEVYAFFRRLGVFYIAESHEPFKLLKVIVDEGYSVERPVIIWGQSEIPLKVLKPVFRQSLHTTLDIDQEGIQFNNKWAYGMGTWFPENYDQYSFVSTAESIKQPRFHNAGTEEVKFIQQKESVIEIKLNQSANWFEIVDDAGNVFRIDRTMYSGDTLRISGSEVTLNGESVIGDTNYTFLSAKTSWNYWELRNITRFEFNIDFRFLYD